MLAQRYNLRGRVQGVGFRYFTLQKARELGIRGWVRNLSSGDVEVYAEGCEEDMRIFFLHLGSGPTFAMVEQVNVQEVEPGKYQSFSICR